MSFFSSRELQHLCSLQQISTEDSIVLPQFIIQSSRKNFCSLKSKIFTGHQKRKSYARTGAFHNKFNNGQAQFKFKAASAEIARQGWMAILKFIFWRNGYADRDKAMTEATTASFLLFPATTQRRYVATETRRLMSITSSNQSVCGMCCFLCRF